MLHVYNFSEDVERCQKWSDNITQQIDLAFNIFFMVYFFIRVSIFLSDETYSIQKSIGISKEVSRYFVLL